MRFSASRRTRGRTRGIHGLLRHALPHHFSRSLADGRGFRESRSLSLSPLSLSLSLSTHPNTNVHFSLLLPIQLVFISNLLIGSNRNRKFQSLSFWKFSVTLGPPH